VSNLVGHAERELDLAGLGDPDSDYNGMLKDAALQMVKVFAEQGHSGMSASILTGILGKLLAFEPLTPLTGAEDEWLEIPEHQRFGDVTHQNLRCSRVFLRSDGSAFDIHGRAHRNKDGDTYMELVDVTFPCTPTTTIVDIPGD
jgi:hypothetical protein